MSEQRYLVLDTETSGLAHGAGVCEIAWIEVDENLAIIDRRYSLIDPQVPISASASGVHGITDMDVCDAPTMDEFFGIVLPGEGWDPHGEFTLIAHNANFDRRLTEHKLHYNSMICTLRLARRVWPDMENHKLATLMYALNLRKGKSHSADGDVDTCHDLLCRIAEATGMSLAEMAEATVTPQLIEIIPFGKHKGTPMPALPKSYVRWLKNLDDLDIDMKHSLEHFYP